MHKPHIQHQHQCISPPTVAACSATVDKTINTYLSMLIMINNKHFFQSDWPMLCQLPTELQEPTADVCPLKILQKPDLKHFCMDRLSFYTFSFLVTWQQPTPSTVMRLMVLVIDVSKSMQTDVRCTVFYFIILLHWINIASVSFLCCHFVWFTPKSLYLWIQNLFNT